MMSLERTGYSTLQGPGTGRVRLCLIEGRPADCGDRVGDRVVRARASPEFTGSDLQHVTRTPLMESLVFIIQSEGSA